MNKPLASQSAACWLPVGSRTAPGLKSTTPYDAKLPKAGPSDRQARSFLRTGPTRPAPSLCALPCFFSQAQDGSCDHSRTSKVRAPPSFAEDPVMCCIVERAWTVERAPRLDSGDIRFPPTRTSPPSSCYCLDSLGPRPPLPWSYLCFIQMMVTPQSERGAGQRLSGQIPRAALIYAGLKAHTPQALTASG